MARRQRITLGGYVYHVMNRANGRLHIFRTVGDFLAFERILGEAIGRFAMRLCGYCLMSNHWHLLLWPHGDGDLSDFMRWVTLTHTQRYHAFHDTVGMGHLYRGRYKSFPVQDDCYYLTAMRYIESNPLRAGLVQAAGQWPWSSFAIRQGRDAPFALSAGPLDLPGDWARLVHEPFVETELADLRKSLKRGAPLGRPHWQETAAARLHLEATLKPLGRPRRD
jgi:putative transposase